MKTNHPHLISAGHLINNETHKPVRLDELDTSQCVKPLKTGEVIVFCQTNKPFSSFPVYIHPNIQRFYDRFGTDYLKNVRRLK